MNILTQIDLTVRMLSPLAQHHSQRQTLELLPRVNHALESLLGTLDGAQSSLRLLTYVYQQPMPPEAEETREAVRRIAASAPSADEALSGGALLDLMQRINDASQRAAQAARAVQEALLRHRQAVQGELTRAKLMLRLPDLFPSPDEQRRFERARAEVERLISAGDVELKRDEERFRRSWAEHYTVLERIRQQCSLEELQRRHGLSEATVSVIYRLLEGKPVQLSDLTADILSDLGRLEYLRSQIVLLLHAR